MRSRFLLIPLALAAGLAIAAATPPASIYDFELDRIDGESEALSTYRGKVILIVNVASKCGFTPQYEDLEALYERYRDRGFVVLGFPANDFNGQEPGSNEEIAEYCRATWGVRFPMFQKITVKGEEQHPLYAYITSQPAPIGGPIQWNFQKFLVDRQGRIVERYSPRISPTEPDVVRRIEQLLGEEARDGTAGSLRPAPSARHSPH